MTLILTLPPDREAEIIEEAAAAGLTPEDYALSLLGRSGRPFEQPNRPFYDRSPEAAAARIERLERWSRGRPAAPHLSDEEISREAIYSRDA